LGIAEATRAKKIERPKTSDVPVRFFLIGFNQKIKYLF
jgi:hypothetical protein